MLIKKKQILVGCLIALALCTKESNALHTQEISEVTSINQG